MLRNNNGARIHFWRAARRDASILLATVAGFFLQGPSTNRKGRQGLPDSSVNGEMKQLKLQRDTLAIGTIEGARRPLTIPAGETIQVESVPTGGIVDVRWKDKLLTMFEVDLGFPENT